MSPYLSRPRRSYTEAEADRASRRALEAARRLGASPAEAAIVVALIRAAGIVAFYNLEERG